MQLGGIFDPFILLSGEMATSFLQIRLFSAVSGETDVKRGSVTGISGADRGKRKKLKRRMRKNENEMK